MWASWRPKISCFRAEVGACQMAGHQSTRWHQAAAPSLACVPTYSRGKAAVPYPQLIQSTDFCYYPQLPQKALLTMRPRKRTPLSSPPGWFAICIACQAQENAITDRTRLKAEQTAHLSLSGETWVWGH